LLILFAATDLDTSSIPLLSDVSTLPSDQIEVSAFGNQAGGPAAVLPVPKVTNPVGCLNEICVVRKLSIPQYESKGEAGVAHMKFFTMGVWVQDMNLRGMLNFWYLIHILNSML